MQRTNVFCHVFIWLMVPIFFITCRKLRFRQVYRTVRFVCLFGCLHDYSKMLAITSTIFTSTFYNLHWLGCFRFPQKSDPRWRIWRPCCFLALAPSFSDLTIWFFACGFLKWCSTRNVTTAFWCDLPFSSYMQITFWLCANFVIFQAFELKLGLYM